tara:strand:- start:3608 stop:4012 length:405 start_codon:yes stop_codon:yes gene_type:complete
MELPKVNIAVIGVVCSSLGGMVWYASEQASIIANLQETVSVLTAENSATERVNLQRDVQQNAENIDELLDILIELEEEGQETFEDVMSEFDDVYETQEGFLLQFNQIIKLQARIKTLENTIEYLTRRPINSDGR